MNNFFVIFYLSMAFFAFLQSCGNAKKGGVSEKKDESFDTAHVAIKYIPADYQDSLRKVYKVEYRWLVHEKDEDSTVEFYNKEGKIEASRNYSEFGKLKNETLYTYNNGGSLIEIKEKQAGILTYKRVYVRKDTMKIAEYYLNMERRDTILKLRYTHNEKQQIIAVTDVSQKEIYTTKHEYWPNGLLHKEFYYVNDSLVGQINYRHNHSGHLRETEGNNYGSYLYEKRLYDDFGRLREKNVRVGIMGVSASQSYILNYNEKHLLRRIGYIKDVNKPKKLQDMDPTHPDGHQSEITYIHYKFKDQK